MDHTPVQLPVLHWGRPEASRRVLLLHGLTSAAACWWRVADELAGAGWSVTAPDLRGHGLAPRTRRYDIGGFVADVLLLRPPSLPERPTAWDLVVGHSLGGVVATAAASFDHSWADRLLLLDPVITLRKEAAEGFLRAIAAEVRDADPEQMLRENPRWHPEDAYLKAQAANQTTPYVAETVLRDNAPWSYETALTTYPHPVTVLAADPNLDAVFSPDDGRRIEHVHAAFRWSVVEGAGHSLYRENPQAVIAAALESI